MIPQEYIDKIYDKIGKANLSNVLKIADDIKSQYDFNELVNGLNNKCRDSISTQMEKCHKMCEVIGKWSAFYNSDFNYNKNMIIDNFVMELCSSMRKY